MSETQQEKEARDRHELVELALTEVSQAPIDLFLAVVAGDPEKRSASFWLAESFVYMHKYQDRLRKYAQERKDAQERKQNLELFNKYIAMTPPKSAIELVTLMQRFNIAPQVPIPQAEAAPSKEQSKSSAA